MRRLLISCALVLYASFGGVAFAQTPTSVPVAEQPAFTPEQQAEIAAAEANAALVAAQGDWISGEEPAYPDEERALGHHGRVQVRGLLGVDGRLRYATVSQSSRAPRLDEIALASAMADTYRPARDASGNPIPVMFVTTRSFYSFTSAEGVGAAMYTCPQFVADMDWFKATWDEEALRRHYFYLLIRGLGAVARMNAGGGFANIESNEAFAARWDRAIETCRDHPNWRFAQAMRPEGEYIDRMARQRRGR